MTGPTQEQIMGFWEVKVKFKSYFKYSFTFHNNTGYLVHVGGIHDEIYRCSIKADTEYTIKQVFDECGGSLRVYLNDNLLYEEGW